MKIPPETEFNLICLCNGSESKHHGDQDRITYLYKLLSKVDNCTLRVQAYVECPNCHTYYFADVTKDIAEKAGEE